MWSLLRKNKLKIKLRPETDKDYYAIHDVVERAFRNEEVSDHHEQYLVTRLRTSDAFIPELSLVATIDDEIIGHVLLTKITIDDNGTSHESLALAPVSVIPKYQRKGVGTKMINRAHAVARVMDYKSVVLLGYKEYYSRFGYEQLSSFGIEMPFDVDDELCMAKEIVKGGLKGVKGKVHYPKEFFQDSTV